VLYIDSFTNKPDQRRSSICRFPTDHKSVLEAVEFHEGNEGVLLSGRLNKEATRNLQFSLTSLTARDALTPLPLQAQGGFEGRGRHLRR